MFASISDNKLDTTESEGDLHGKAQHKQEEEVHLVAIENAINETGTLDHTLVHGVFVGPPRSGKDSLMKHLLGELTPSISPSTGTVETVIHVKVEESCTYAATIGQSNWTRLAYDEEALHLMKTALSNKSYQYEGESTDIQVVDPPLAVKENIPDAIGSAQKSTTQTNNALDSQLEIDPQPIAFYDETFLQVKKVDQTHRKSKHKTPNEIFKEAIKKKDLEGLKGTNEFMVTLSH